MKSICMEIKSFSIEKALATKKNAYLRHLQLTFLHNVSNLAKKTEILQEKNWSR